MRLSARRLEMQMPLSMTEIVAERDQLRAEFAAERRKLEQKSEHLAASLATGRAQLGVRSARIIELDEALAAATRENAEALAQISELEQSVNELGTERAVLEKQLYDTQWQLDKRVLALDTLAKKHADLESRSDEQRITIAGLETKLSSVEMDLSAVQDELKKTSKELGEKISQALFLERERDQFRSDVAAASARRDQLQKSLIALQARIEMLDGDLRTERREKTRLAESAAVLKQELGDVLAREKRLGQEIKVSHDGLAKTEAAFEEKIAARRAGEAALQGALDAARREIRSLRSGRTGQHGNSAQVARVVSAGDAAGQPDLSALRQAIADLGSDIIRLAGAEGNKSGMAHADTGRAANEISRKVQEITDKAKSAVTTS